MPPIGILLLLQSLETDPQIILIMLIAWLPLLLDIYRATLAPAYAAVMMAQIEGLTGVQRMLANDQSNDFMCDTLLTADKTLQKTIVFMLNDQYSSVMKGFSELSDLINLDHSAAASLPEQFRMLFPLMFHMNSAIRSIGVIIDGAKKECNRDLIDSLESDSSAKPCPTQTLGRNWHLVLDSGWTRDAPESDSVYFQWNCSNDHFAKINAWNAVIAKQKYLIAQFLYTTSP